MSFCTNSDKILLRMRTFLHREYIIVISLHLKVVDLYCVINYKIYKNRHCKKQKNCSFEIEKLMKTLKCYYFYHGMTQFDLKKPCCEIATLNIF